MIGMGLGAGVGTLGGATVGMRLGAGVGTLGGAVGMGVGVGTGTLCVANGIGLGAGVDTPVGIRHGTLGNTALGWTYLCTLGGRTGGEGRRTGGGGAC